LQLAAILLDAIAPQPCLAELRKSWSYLRRHLNEPPRKRRNYQTMTKLF